MPVRVRLMTAGDIDAVAELCGQLGYPNTAAEVAARFKGLDERPPNAVFVAEDDGEVADVRPDGAGRLIVGWIHVHEVLTLETGPFADLGGLVVRDSARGRGVGRLLLAAAERWAIQRGYREMRVRSNVVRLEAHEFYRRQGYEVLKTQLNFRKPLSSRSS